MLAAAAWWRLSVASFVWVRDLNILNYDDYAYYYPTFRYAFGRLAQGEFPWWNPYQLCGTPFFATGQHLLLYPLNVFYLALATATAMKWTAILHFALAIVFTFVCGRVFGLSVVGAATAGIVFAFSGSLVLLLYLPHHLYGAVWLPLVAALAELTWNRPRPLRWGIALGVALGCQYLGGYPMYSLFSAYLVAGHAAWRLVGAFIRGGPAWLPRLGALAVAALTALVLSLPQLLPAIELARRSPRAFGALSLEMADPTFGKASAPWSWLAGLVVPIDGNGFPAYGYIGLAALVAVAVAPLGRGRAVGFFGAVTLLAWALAFGTRTPLYRLYFALPTASWFRLPARFLVPGCLGLALLAGVGVDVLARVRTARAVALAVGAAIIAVGGWRVRFFFALNPWLAVHLTVVAAWVAAVGLL